MKVLVTGGAGYIGSHVVRQLGAAGYDTVVLDNLSTGRPWAVIDAELVVGDISDPALLEALFRRHRFDAVLHFAASIVVPESVREPLRYYGNNTRNMLALLEFVERFEVPNYVFSSTAAVYGVPGVDKVAEDAPLAPINPYGASKAMSERILSDLALARPWLKHVTLRYFNVAGAAADGRIGQATRDATHLIKVACQAALGERSGVEIYGTDYPTPDGTGVRDYIHVEDLARAHLDALEYLARGNPSVTLNCGYGHGYSVREVLASVAAVSGVDFAVSEGPRRPGDPAALVADAARARELLGWRPRFDDLETIVRHAWQWEKRLAAGSPATGPA